MFVGGQDESIGDGCHERKEKKLALTGHAVHVMLWTVSVTKLRSL
jgi:hypothetical protein